jgi:hypothetical protein
MPRLRTDVHGETELDFRGRAGSLRAESRLTLFVTAHPRDPYRRDVATTKTVAVPIGHFSCTALVACPRPPS